MFEALRTQSFPAEVVSGITARSVPGSLMSTLWRELSPQVETSFADLGNYVAPPARLDRSQALRDVYAKTHSENLVFYDGEKPVGWSSGVMIDDVSFFMSYSAVLPSYRRRGIYSGFLRLFLPYLSALGYERVTSNHMANNRAVLIAKLRAGFFVTGMVLDERYGAQVSLTHLLHAERRTGFAHAFSLEDDASVPDYS